MITRGNLQNGVEDFIQTFSKVARAASFTFLLLFFFKSFLYCLGEFGGDPSPDRTDGAISGQKAGSDALFALFTDLITCLDKGSDFPEAEFR